MKQWFVVMMSLFLVFIFAACGDSGTEEKKIDNVESGAQDIVENVENRNENNEAETETESASYDEVLLDDEVAKVTLTGIETVRDEIFGDEYKIKLEIENKSDKTIIVQSDQVSLDGLMVGDMVFFSETVAGEKRAVGSMDIMALEDELPDFNENLEFKLIVIDEETFSTISETPISVDIK